MPEWWDTVLSYSPQDLLLFSERVYWRLFVQNNAALWPAQFAALAAGLALIAVTLRPPHWAGRAWGLILAAAWALAAWSFLWRHYAPVNPAATYAAWLAGIEAVLLAGSAVLHSPPSGRIPSGQDAVRPEIARWDGPRRAGLVLLVWAVLLHPLLAPLDGRAWGQAELFALTPDPTALATLGVLLAARPGPARLILLALPWLWCLASAVTLATMGAWLPALPLILAAVGVPAILIVSRRGTDPRRMRHT